jgi:SNF2 family DNA or RNA helicase
MMKLRPYQHQMLEHIQRTPRCLLWSFMGSGKSVSTLTAIDNLSLVEEVYPVLVIAPLRVAQSTWPQEVEKWAHLKHLRVSCILGSKKEREAALKTPADIYCINYEGLPWLVETLQGQWPFAMIVADESTRLKGFRTRQGGKRARALGLVAARSSRFIALSGTPVSNGIVDLWGQCYFVDRGERLGRTFSAFRNRWFRSIRVGSDAFAVKLEPMPHSQKEIEGRLSDVCMSLDARDHFDIDEPIINIIKVTLPDPARLIYQEMEQEMYVALHQVEAVNAASKTIKCLQIANGTLYTDEKGTWAAIHDEKLQALESVIEEAAGMPVLVAYNFKSDLDRLLKRFPQGRAMDKNPQTISDWNAGLIPILFLHPKSAGHGLNLQDGGNILCFFALDWNLEERLQVIERIGPVRQAQAGHQRPVFIHYIIAEKTIDEVVLARVDSKKTVMDAMMEAMKK